MLKNLILKPPMNHSRFPMDSFKGSCEYCSVLLTFKRRHHEKESKSEWPKNSPTQSGGLKSDLQVVSQFGQADLLGLLDRPSWFIQLTVSHTTRGQTCKEAEQEKQHRESG